MHAPDIREERAPSGALARAFAHVTTALNAAGTCLVFLIMAFATADIAGRVLLNAPLAGVPELVTMSIVGILFLQAPHAVASGGLIRSDLLTGVLQARLPRVAALLEGAYSLVGAAVFAIILYGASGHFLDAWRNGYEFGTPGVFLFPQWPLRLVIVIGCAATVVQFLLLLLLLPLSRLRGAAAPAGRLRPAERSRA